MSKNFQLQLVIWLIPIMLLPPHATGQENPRVTKLIQQLRAKDTALRKRAALELAYYLPADAEASAALAKCFISERDGAVAQAATEGLSKLSDEEQSAIYAQALRHGSRPAKRYALNFLGSLEGAVEDAGEIVPLLADKDADLADAAFETLRLVDQPTPQARAALMAYVSPPGSGRKPGFGKQRLRALRVLQSWGVQNAEDIQILKQLLTDGDPVLREAAARAIGASGEWAASATAELDGLLPETDPLICTDPDAFQICASAAGALAALGEKAEASTAKLAAAATEDLCRIQSRRALAAIGTDSAKEVLLALSDSTNVPAGTGRKVSADLQAELSKLDKPAAKNKSDTKTLKQLRSADQEQRLEAALTLARKGYADDALPVLMEIIESAADGSEHGRLGQLIDDKGGARGLNAYLRSNQQLTRDSSPQARAVRGLVHLGPRAAAALPTLVAYLGSKEQVLRAESIEALASLAPRSIPALNAALGQKNPLIRAGAAEALGRAGISAAATIPDLQRLSFEDSVGVRTASRLAVKSLGAELCRTAAAP